MNNITTIAGQTFTWEESVDLARLVFKRFGNNIEDACHAWNRLLSNNCDEAAFGKLVFARVCTPHCVGENMCDHRHQENGG